MHEAPKTYRHMEKEIHTDRAHMMEAPKWKASSPNRSEARANKVESRVPG